MSKKLASGADHIVLDVKVGRGAFMKDLENAQALLKRWCQLVLHTRDCVCINFMEQPLGMRLEIDLK